MDAISLSGGFDRPSVDAARAFRAILEAMSRPGSVQQIVGAAPPPPLGIAAGCVALTLCDHDTTVWLGPSVDTRPVRDWLTFHTGAPVGPRERADFAFGAWDEMVPMDDWRLGTPDYPDASATLVVEVPALRGEHRLTGPGIQTEARMTVPDAAAFRTNRARFPLGWDAVLTCVDQLAALPRTVIVEG